MTGLGRLCAPLAAAAVLASCGGTGPSGTDPARTVSAPPPTPTQSPAPSPSPASSPPRAQPAGVLPDRQLTPGAVASTDPSVVCAPGYSDSVRPPASYTSALKRRQLAADYPGTGGLPAAQVEEDHLVMLALGGDPRSEQNLWPEPRQLPAADGTEGGADAKDQYEAWLYDQVCRRHTIPLTDAQHDLATDWYAAWTAAGRPRSGGTGG